MLYSPIIFAQSSPSLVPPPEAYIDYEVYDRDQGFETPSFDDPYQQLEDPWDDRVTDLLEEQYEERERLVEDGYIDENDPNLKDY